MFRRVVRSVLLALLVILLAIQLVPVHRTNPTFDPSGSLERSASVPANVKAIPDRSCKDCHSNETRLAGIWLRGADVMGARA
jgi:Haem-binding domain